MTSTSQDRLFGANSSIAIKAPCRVATTANITLSGEQTIDGVAVVTNDRVLVKDQTDGTENGIYIADTSTWQRAPDFDGARDVATGTLVKVTAGTVNGGFIGELTTTGTITPGTTSIAFAMRLGTLGSVTAWAQTFLAAVTAIAARLVLGFPAIAAAGDYIVGTAADTLGIVSARASVAAHATTMNLWTARENILTGGAVTITDIADAPYAGAVAWVKMNAAHIWTHGGGVFDVQGSATYTAADGDWVRIHALSTSTFSVTVFKQSGAPVSMSRITNSLAADVVLNNTANYFDGPSVAQGTSGVWFASGKVTINDTAGGAQHLIKLWDGTTVIDSCTVYEAATSQPTIASLSGVISSPAGNIRISVRDASSTSGNIKANASGNSKDSTVTAIRIG